MLTINNNQSVSPQYIGEFISKNQYLNLANGFKSKFPSEISSVVISKSVVEHIITQVGVSGIRFMYGLGNVDDPSSRIIILMPCNFTMNGNIPNVIFSSAGFLDNMGRAITLEESYKALFAHVMRFKGIEPDTQYTKVIRGYYFGKEKLAELLSKANSDMVYNFGYDINSAKPFKAVIQPANGAGTFLDNGEECPTNCIDPNLETCMATYISNMFEADSDRQLNILRAFRDEKLNEDAVFGVEIEKYYTISASIMEMLKNDSEQTAISKQLYNDYFKASIDSLKNHDTAKAIELFKDCIQFLTDKYWQQ